jgi:hypothetical protein
LKEESKALFFEKKASRPENQKTFSPLRAALAPPKPREAEQKFFCYFFFKKSSAS